MLNFGLKKSVSGKRKRRIGLDIGSGSIKVLEVTRQEGSEVLSGLGLKKVADASKDGLANAIKDLANEANISAREVSISVSGPSVIVRFIVMPKMSEDDLKSALRFEAEKLIPFNMNDCVMDFQTLKKDRPDNKQDILLAAARKDFILERIEAVESAGFSVRKVDVDGFALANAFLANFPHQEKEKTVTLLNIGTTVTNLSILSNGAILLTRDIIIGGKDIDEMIAKTLNISKGAAEELKLAPKDKAAEVTSSSRAVLNNLFDDVKLSFNYYENQCGRGVDELYVSGGSSGFAGLEAAFQEAFGMKPVFWDPLKFLISNSPKIDIRAFEKTKNCFAVAAGLALR